MNITIIQLIEEIIKQNPNLVIEYCTENKSTDNLAIYGKFLSKLPYNDVNFVIDCLEHFNTRLKAECRSRKCKDEDE